MESHQVFAFVVFAAFSALAWGQGAVFRESEIEESRLIDALTPPVKTRGIRPVPHEPNARVPAANLLITFETNSADLTPQAKRALDAVGQALKSDRLSDFEFVIEGHADPRGTADLNQRLSEERARSVRQYLIQNHRIADSRLRSVGRGESTPLNAANPAAPENRRVTIITRID